MHSNVDLNIFLWHFAFALGGVFITHHLHHTFKQGGVRASAGSSLLVGLLFYLIPDLFPNDLQTSLPLIFIGASFIGMSNTQHFNTGLQLILAGTIFAGIFTFSDHLFSGYGGKLGLMANISVVSTIGVYSLINKRTIKD